MRKIICLITAVLILTGGLALAQTKSEEPKAPGQQQPQPAGAPEQPQQMKGMGMVCPMPAMEIQNLQKQIGELRQRVEALEAQLKKKK